VTKSHLCFSGTYQEPEKYLPYAAKYIANLKAQNAFVKEETDSYYIYEQISAAGKSCKGIIGLCSVYDYHANKIKKHEEIRPSRLKFLIELFKSVRVMGEPTLLAHNTPINFENIASDELYSFTSPDDKQHIISRVSDVTHVNLIQQHMNAIGSFYIADGHHRSASAAEFNELTKGPDSDRTMCYVVHESQLEIYPFHRLIKPYNGVNKEELIGRLSSYFKITKSDVDLYNIATEKDFGLYIDNEWFLLSYKNASDLLDVEILEEVIVRNIFNIQDSRTDSQITFHPYTSGLEELISLIDNYTYTVAITTKACDFASIRKVAEAHNVLPPKSTYIEPKLRAGLIIQEFL
jgi:uncharacterized protein (DUF1015 family)